MERKVFLVIGVGRELEGYIAKADLEAEHAVVANGLFAGDGNL